MKLCDTATLPADLKHATDTLPPLPYGVFCSIRTVTRTLICSSTTILSCGHPMAAVRVVNARFLRVELAGFCSTAAL